MTNSPHDLAGRRAAALLVVLLALAATSAAADRAVPLDIRGLPLWEVRVWSDFPVRIELPTPEALTELLQRVPIASFDREQVRPVRDGSGPWHLLFQPRVTESELAALTAAGYAATRLPDREREERRAMEAAWAAQAAKGGATLTTGEKGVYHTHAQIGQVLQQIATDHPAIARYYSLGNSVQGRALHALEISGEVGVEQAEPEVRLASTIHGNEPVQLENLLTLAEYLTDNYGVDPVVTDLVDHTDIHIVPCLNPDGLVAGRRYNAHAFDLNRNYPVPDGYVGDDGTYSEEPETILVKSHGAAHHFVVSEVGHTGALVTNYPWDYTYTLTPDDAAIIDLSLEYSSHNPPMYASPAFPQGITNGAQWYIVRGSLQDWSYQQTGCVDLTIEVSDTFIPPASELDQLWNDNRESLLALIAAARYGVHGVVTDADTGLPLAVTITVTGNAKPVATDPALGDYYKLLPTGTYELTFAAADHVPRTMSGVTTTWGTGTVLDVQLEPIGTSVETPSSRVLALACRPNPFNPATTVAFTLPRPGRATLAVYDVRGRLVRRLLDERLPAGEKRVGWNGADDAGRKLASGVYVARLRTEGEASRTLKLVLGK